ncbi:TerD family protein [Streptomyces sp. NPDC097619]|uniref:TerD family protein n=1 Tax=Streptomyces sp. NPDC097619 TaxID=3157228 RepID=UPI00331FFEA7
MREMVQGSNIALAALSENTGSVIAGLSWVSPTGEGDADVSVLLLDGNGKVRGDGDFYFYNNAVAPDGSVRLLGKTPTDTGDEDRISFDLTAVPPGVHRMLIAASRHGGAGFGELEDLKVTLADATGEGLLTFAVDDADTKSAIIFGELYRRAGEWKFRAVGQGYDTGLAGLATDFGVDIDDAAEAEEPEDGVDAAGGTDATDVAGGEVRVTAGGAAPAPVTAAAPTADRQPEGTPSAATAPIASLVPVPRGPVDATAGMAGTGGAPGVVGVAGAERTAAARPRTAKKKVTLPKVARKSLADNDSWQQARLFPLSVLRSDRDREMRATSVLLSVMAQVPEFGRRLTAAFGAPSGRMETFTEVSLPHGDAPRRPDGIIRVERAGKLWTALVETKTNGNALKAEQVQAYADIAARRGYEAVITLSNDVALEGSPLVAVKADGRRKHKVALWHLSWAEVAYQAQMLIRYEGVGDKSHAWLLQELLHYLRHENSGCHGFQNMGAAWVPVRNGIDDETLCQGDPRALDVVESWERLIRQICLSLGGEIGEKVLPVQRAKRGADPQARRARAADQLCLDGRLQAELRVDGAPGILAVCADMRTGKLRTSVEIPAPTDGYPLTWAKRLVRRLAEAPADLHVETLVDGDTGGPRGTLERLRPEPAGMLPQNGDRITGFRLSLFKSMGSTRGNAETGFIRSVDEAVHRFHTHVATHLAPTPPRRTPKDPPTPTT